MKNLLIIAWIALSLVLACTPARQVAEQHRPPVSPLAQEEPPAPSLSASPVSPDRSSDAADLSEGSQVPIQHFRQNPAPAPTPTNSLIAAQPTAPAQQPQPTAAPAATPPSAAPAPASGQHLAQAAAKAASTTQPAKAPILIDEDTAKTQALPALASPQVQPERLPAWVNRTPAVKEAPTPQPASAPQSQDELLLLMDQLVAEMETDSVAQSEALAAPYPGQVRQVGEITIEYREEKTAAAPATAHATAPAAANTHIRKPVSDIGTALVEPTARQPLSPAEADEIMRRALLRREAEAAQAQTPARTEPQHSAPQPEASFAEAAPAGVGITFMRAESDPAIDLPAIVAQPKTIPATMPETGLQLAILDGRMIDLDEARLMEWEAALLARKSGRRSAVILPTWLLQGLEWLAHAPTAEPQRSLTIMPLYRHMESAGHLNAFNADKMSDEQVVRALRLLVDEAKSKKKLQGAAQPPLLNPDLLHANDLTHTDTEELAQPSPVVQALSFEGQPSKSGPRFPADDQQEPGIPVTDAAFSYLTADAADLLPVMRSQAPARLISSTDFSPKTTPVATPVLEPLSPIPTEADRRITRRKAYVNKLTRFSVRAAYGFGQYRSTMQYELPNLEATVAEAVNSLQSQYAWVPWGQVEVPTTAPQRERVLNKRGQFRIAAGLNVPLGFIEIEAGPGRFSESAYSLQDVWPPWQGLDMTRAGELMMQRVATPEAKTSMTLRMGTELERLLPEHLLPKLRLGKKLAMGFDASAYYLTGTDLSYRTGVELLDPHAVDHLQDLFDPIPLIPKATKTQAAEAIVAHVESSLPGYFWLPALRGYGLGAKAYVNLNPRLRFAARYQFERSQGLRLESTDWMPRGPVVSTTSFSFGIETQI